jgi:hypothetical protein
MMSSFWLSEQGYWHPVKDKIATTFYRVVAIFVFFLGERWVG